MVVRAFTPDTRVSDLPWTYHQLCGDIGEYKLKDFAADIDEPCKQVCLWRNAFHTYDESGQPDPLHYTHYERAVSQADRVKLLRQAVAEGWSTTKLSQFIHNRNQQSQQDGRQLPIPDEVYEERPFIRTGITDGLLSNAASSVTSELRSNGSAQ